MVIDWSIVVLIGIGILLGGIAFSPSFRKKFFVGLRNFIWGKKSSSKKTEDPPEVRRHYTRTIKMVLCPTCKGRKRVPKKLPAIADQSLAPMVKCPTCDGAGEVPEGMFEE